MKAKEEGRARFVWWRSRRGGKRGREAVERGGEGERPFYMGE